MQTVFFNIPILMAKDAIAELIAIGPRMIAAVTAPGSQDVGRFPNSHYA